MLTGTTEITVGRAIEEFLLERRLRNLSPETITSYAKCFRRGLVRYSDVLLSQVTITEIRGLVAEMMDAGRSAGTVNGTLQAI